MPDTIAIREGGLDHPQVVALLREHLATMATLSPPESVHALDLDGLRGPDVRFWSAWDGDALLGCGALRRIDAAHAELKSMRTVTAHRRRGVASALLRHLLAECVRRGYARVSLETGSADAFAPARALYARFGFAPCAPFADYVADPHSVFLTRTP